MSDELKNKEVEGKIVEENVDAQAQQGTPEGNPAPAPQPQDNTQNDGNKPKETFFGKVKKTVKAVWEHPVTQGVVKVGTTTLKVGGVVLAVIGGAGVIKAAYDSKHTSSVPEETTLTTDEPDVSEESYSCEEEQEEPKEEFHDVTEDITYYDDVYKTDEETEETTQE